MMTQTPTRLQNTRVKRLIQQAGAFRVSAGAVTALNDILVDYAGTIAGFAVQVADHSGRKTVKESDIVLATQR